MGRTKEGQALGNEPKGVGLRKGAKSGKAVGGGIEGRSVGSRLGRGSCMVSQLANMGQGEGSPMAPPLSHLHFPTPRGRHDAGGPTAAGAVPGKAWGGPGCLGSLGGGSGAELGTQVPGFSPPLFPPAPRLASTCRTSRQRTAPLCPTTTSACPGACSPAPCPTPISALMAPPPPIPAPHTYTPSGPGGACNKEEVFFVLGALVRPVLGGTLTQPCCEGKGCFGPTPLLSSSVGVHSALGGRHWPCPLAEVTAGDTAMGSGTPRRSPDACALSSSGVGRCWGGGGWEQGVAWASWRGTSGS